jgi:hypothetical protein
LVATPADVGYAVANQPAGLAASSQVNAQTTADGSLFVGWGSLPYSPRSTQPGI